MNALDWFNVFTIVLSLIAIGLSFRANRYSRKTEKLLRRGR